MQNAWLLLLNVLFQAPYCLRNSHVAILLKLLDIGHFLCMVQHKGLLIAINEAERYLLPT